MSDVPKGLLPARPADYHKGQAGRVFIAAGSLGMSGAAWLCAQAALRAGGGLVTLGLPKSLQLAMSAKLTEVMSQGFPETKEGSLSTQALFDLVKAVEGSDAAALGPGVSLQPQTTALIRQLLPKVNKPLVLDADGLNALAEDVSLLKTLALPIILTPHPGEMGRLIRQDPQDIQRDRERTASNFATQYRVVVVLKGHRTVVAGYDGSVYTNETGNPGMATGGCGDVLTGVIAGLLGQRLSLVDAAQLGVYLHGLAGDLAAAKQGQVGLIASDLLDTIPHAIRRYLDRSS